MHQTVKRVLWGHLLTASPTHAALAEITFLLSATLHSPRVTNSKEGKIQVAAVSSFFACTGVSIMRADSPFA